MQGLLRPEDSFDAGEAHNTMDIMCSRNNRRNIDGSVVGKGSIKENGWEKLGRRLAIASEDMRPEKRQEYDLRLTFFVRIAVRTVRRYAGMRVGVIV